MEIKVSLDNKRYTSKPDDSEVAKISFRIAKSPECITNEVDMHRFAEAVGKNGYSWCPATFQNGKRDTSNYVQMQLFVLDFDNDKPTKMISWEQIFERAEKYDIPILFAYETFSSENRNKFRVVFLNDISIPNFKVANVILTALRTIFPESDDQCKNAVQLYFGGKNLFYFNKSLPTINIESLIRNMTFYLKNKYGDTNYKRKIYEFAETTGLGLNQNKMLDVRLTEIHAEEDFNKISPESILLPIIINDGDILLNWYYSIKFDRGSTSNCSAKKLPANHAQYRSSDINIIRQQCRLFKEFENGERWLDHNELYGIAVALTQIETGKKIFLDILLANSHHESYVDKHDQWDYYLDYFKKNEYKPQNCNDFCPYKDTCQHSANILSTAKPKNYNTEKLANYAENYYPIQEVEADVYGKIKNAVDSTDREVHVIKAQTAIGKTHTYIELMEDSERPFLIAAPTNILKHDIYRRALEKGITDIMETPSLYELLQNNNIPRDVRNCINKYYKLGNHRAVIPYIKKVLKEYDIQCLKDYLDDLDKFKKFDGHIITTHRKLLTFNEETLSKYAVIVDEDIIYKAVMTNQEMITISDLKKMRKNINPDSSLAYKVCQIFESVQLDKPEHLFKVNPIEFDIEEENDDISVDFDISSLCRAEHFCFLKESKQKHILQDCITFLKPVKFQDVKFIVVSATADKTIYNYYFGADRVKFYECKKAMYQGTLCQYYDRSMSRADIRKNSDTFKKIKDRLGNLYTITFDEFKKIIDELELHLNEADLHFGNTEGCDFLAGHKINVVGTPHYPPHLYKLFAYTIGLSFDVNAEIKKDQLVSHNGYRFKFTTYPTEKVLKDIQLWVIETELEQAVGRARLLRRKTGHVNLFSNFPLVQSSMKRFEWSK